MGCSMRACDAEGRWRVFIRGFYQDEEGHWAARLECGHGQPVRHDPPWIVRGWVTSEEGRAARIGSLTECKKWDEGRSRGS
jgi:hypothetical protein